MLVLRMCKIFAMKWHGKWNSSIFLVITRELWWSHFCLHLLVTYCIFAKNHIECERKDRLIYAHTPGFMSLSLSLFRFLSLYVCESDMRNMNVPKTILKSEWVNEWDGREKMRKSGGLSMSTLQTVSMIYENFHS